MRPLAFFLLATLPGAACSADTRNAAAQDAMPFTVTPVAQFQAPFALAVLPGGGILVTEKAGVLKLRRADGAVVVVNGAPAVAEGGQGGLLDIAPAPDFATSGIIYLSYAEPGASGSTLALMRARLSTGAAPQLSQKTVIFRAGSEGKGGQFGATIAFAPDGKSLFLASGERQRFTPAQDPDQALGKILHLTLDGKPWPGNPAAGRTGASSVKVTDPPKNTAAAETAPARTVAVAGTNLTPAETWSSGHRNPYGLAFDAGGRLWEVEMGPKGGDEVNLIQPGRNYGWPKASNGDNYDGTPIPDHRAGDGFEPPKLFWNPSISPGGMMIYSGDLFPAWKGSMFVAALSGEALIRVALNGDGAAKAEQWNMGARIRDVAQAPDGSIWLLEDGGQGSPGRLLKLEPRK
jgi:aldose sugar dehydrogenase